MNKNNLSLHFARLCRHFMATKKNNDIISFLDLAHSFRCLIDIKDYIDSLFERDAYECKFMHISNLRKLKRCSLNGILIINEIITDSGTYSHIGFSKSTITTEELDSYELIKPAYMVQVSTFADWLNREIIIGKNSGKCTPVSREKFLRRISNKFNGSHPYESKEKDEKNLDNKLINNYVDECQKITFLNYNLGYLIMQQAAEELILSILGYFLKDNRSEYYCIFNTYKDTLNEYDLSKKSIVLKEAMKFYIM